MPRAFQLADLFKIINPNTSSTNMFVFQLVTVSLVFDFVPLAGPNLSLWNRKFIVPRKKTHFMQQRDVFPHHRCRKSIRRYFRRRLPRWPPNTSVTSESANRKRSHQTSVNHNASFSSCPLWASNYSRCSSRIAGHSKWWSSLNQFIIELLKKHHLRFGDVGHLEIISRPQYHQPLSTTQIWASNTIWDHGNDVRTGGQRDKCMVNYMSTWWTLTRHQLAVNALLDLANKPPDLSFCEFLERQTSYLAANKTMQVDWGLQRHVTIQKV